MNVMPLASLRKLGEELSQTEVRIRVINTSIGIAVPPPHGQCKAVLVSFSKAFEFDLGENQPRFRFR